MFLQYHRRGSDGSEVTKGRRASEPSIDLKVSVTTQPKPLKGILKKSKFGMPDKEKEKENKDMTFGGHKEEDINYINYLLSSSRF